MWHTSDEGEWVSVDEAYELFEKSEWWKAAGLEGERVTCRRDDSPPDRPIWHLGSKWYVGGWAKRIDGGFKQYQWHGFGVYCKTDGHLFIGYWRNGKLSGRAQRFWLPHLACWKNNNRVGSEILDPQSKVGLPYLYIGHFRENWKDDSAAVVILKDGTTRIGPWKKNKPIGDWWKTHATNTVSGADVAKLLDFGRALQPISIPLMIEAGRVDVLSTGSTLSCSHQRPSRAETPETQSSKEITDESNGSSGSQVIPLQHRGNSGSVFQEQSQTTGDSSSASLNDRHVAQVACWLQDDVIRHGADRKEMEEYAQQFVALGLHSSSMIRELCSPGDVACLHWMKEYHRHCLLVWLGADVDHSGDLRCLRMTEISNWLAETALNKDVGKLDVGIYAKTLYEYGFQSVDMIIDLCTEADIEAFDWMKPAHRRLFLDQRILQYQTRE